MIEMFSNMREQLLINLDIQLTTLAKMLSGKNDIKSVLGKLNG